MQEQKVKKREWVKTAAIIFLTVLLLLTFFSNTILNHSLPEVSAQYISSGTINSKIRGTGTVSANRSYDVVLSQTREVETVCVKVGDTVSTGDVLFILKEGDSEELANALITLEDLQLQYQRALLSQTTSDYAQENRAIQKLQASLEEATAERNALIVSDEAYSAAKTELANANSRLSSMTVLQTAAQGKYDAAEKNLSSLALGGEGDYSTVLAARNALDEANNQLTAANNAYETARLEYGKAYDEMLEETKNKILSDYPDGSTEIAEAYDPNHSLLNADGSENTADKWYSLDDAAKEKAYNSFREAKLAVYLPYQANICKNAEDGGDSAHADHYTAYANITAAQKTIDEAKAAVASAQSAYNTALSAYNDANSDNNTYNQYRNALENAAAELATAKTNTENAQSAVDTAQKALDELDAQKEKYETASDNVKSIQESIEDQLFNLAQQQKSDSVTQQLNALDLEGQRKNIERQEELVEKYRTDTVETEVKANASGTVEAINITAGHSINAGEVMATIVQQDLGYTLSFSVTLEQSKTVSVGDTAEISNYYWGSDIQAKLTAIKNDPTNPGKSKLLEFTITGDVEPGTNLSLSIGQKSQSYDALVPRSAVRSDSNGDFVLVVVAKSTPLGNRYIATRADVKVLASDDTMSAVSGISYNEFVITTSNEPIEPGTQVRLADE